MKDFDQSILTEIGGRLDRIDKRLDLVEGKASLGSADTVMEQTLQAVSEYIKLELGRIRSDGIVQEQVVIEDHSKVTLGQENARVEILEKQIHNVLKKHKTRLQLAVKEVEFKVETKVNRLLKGEFQDKFDVFIDSFDSKLRKLSFKVENLTAQKTVSATQKEDKDFVSVVSNRIDVLAKELKTIKKEVLNNLSPSIDQQPTPSPWSSHIDQRQRPSSALPNDNRKLLTHRSKPAKKLILATNQP